MRNSPYSILLEKIAAPGDFFDCSGAHQPRGGKFSLHQVYIRQPGEGGGGSTP